MEHSSEPSSRRCFLSVCHWSLALAAIFVVVDADEPGTCKTGQGRPAVHAAFYLWYGNPESDGRWLHWDHKVLPHWDKDVDARHPKFNWRPPTEHHAPFRPERGLFSARNNQTLKDQFKELAVAGVDSAMISWWGRKDFATKRDDADSGANTDELVPAVLEAAQLAGVGVSFHVEPYGGRTAQTFLEDLRYVHEQYGSHPAVWRQGPKNLPVFWLYDVSAQHSAGQAKEWRKALDSVRGTELDAVFFCLWIGGQGDARFVEEAGFDGAYTYFAAVGFTPGSRPDGWKDIKQQLDSAGKFFVPAVGPGYDDTLIRPWNAQNVRPRGQGAYYDAMWQAAVNLQPHAVSITSYNEWGEGTQIEPAVPYTSPEGRAYQDYLPQPPDFYLTRTAEWAVDLRGGAGSFPGGMEAAAVAAEDRLPFTEQPRLHVKNTFIEVDGDSDDSLDMSDSWMRASTEPAKVFQQAKTRERLADEARSTKEPQYVYTQQPGTAEDPAREAASLPSWPALDSSSQEGLRILEADPELAPIFESLKMGGVEAASKLCKDAALMQKISRKMDELKLANFLGLLQLHPSVQDETMDLSGLVDALTVLEEAVVQQVTLGAIRTMPCSVTLADPSLDDCPLIGCSEGFEALTGYTSKEVVGQNCRFLNAGVNMDPAMRLAMRDCINCGSEFIGVLPNVRKNGDHFNNLLRMTTTNVRGKRYIIGVQADVSNIKIDLADPIHVEELRATARLIFSSNIDAWIQMQARQYHIRQPVPYAEMLKADTQEQQSMGKFVVMNPPPEEGPTGDAAVNKPCKAPPSAAGSSPVDHTTQLSEQSTCVGGEHTEDQESADGSGATATPEPLRSIGSAGHPDACASECIFYFFRDGCRAAENCRFCHEFHPRKNMKKNRRILRRLCTEGSGGNNEGEIEEPVETPKPAGPSPKAAKAKVAAPQEAPVAPVIHEGPALAGGVCYWYGPERQGSSSQRLTLVVGQKVHLPAHVEVAAEQRQGLQECLSFSVQPALPAGLTWDSKTGHISGTPESESTLSVHTFTASIAATGPNGIDLGQVHLASCKFEISVLDLQRFTLCWGHADESGANLTLQLQPQL